jgi:O-antigen/teichoic acid export membrane protein
LTSYARALFVVDSAFTLFGQVDVLLVGAFLGAGAAGVYQAPTRLVTVLHYPGLAAATSIAPGLAGRGGRPDPSALAAGLRWLLIFQCALVAPLLLWAQPIVDLVLGPGYGESAGVLRALVPFMLLSGVAPLLSNTANYLGQARRRVPIAIATVAVAAALALVLIPRWGIVGAAVAIDVAYALYVPAHLWLCARMVALPLGGLAATLARSLIAAAAMVPVLAAAGTHSLTPFGWVAGSAGAALAYAAALAATRELSAGELRRLVR